MKKIIWKNRINKKIGKKCLAGYHGDFHFATIILDTNIDEDESTLFLYKAESFVPVTVEKYNTDKCKEIAESWIKA